jgi:hypothetical protein
LICVWFALRLFEFNQLQSICYDIAMGDHHSFLYTFNQCRGLDNLSSASTYR